MDTVVLFQLPDPVFGSAERISAISDQWLDLSFNPSVEQMWLCKSLRGRALEGGASADLRFFSSASKYLLIAYYVLGASYHLTLSSTEQTFLHGGGWWRQAAFSHLLSRAQ